MKKCYRYTAIVIGIILLFMFSACSQRAESFTTVPGNNSDPKNSGSTASPALQPGNPGGQGENTADGNSATPDASPSVNNNGNPGNKPVKPDVHQVLPPDENNGDSKDNPGKPDVHQVLPPDENNGDSKDNPGKPDVHQVLPPDENNGDGKDKPGGPGPHEVPPPDRGRLQVDIEFKQNEKDGEQMVLIPAGSFKMGAAPGDDMVKSDEKPLHEVYLDSYYIYVREVSNNDFLRFVKKTGYYTSAETRGEKKNWRGREFDSRLDAPVINVTYDDAMAYCNWVGGRLPTEAEWEKAARGPNDTRIYPWGNKMNTELFNSDMLSFKKYDGVRVGNGVYRAPCRTGMFDDGRSPCETRDMIGNVWEWCLDWYDMEYYKTSPARNPMGPPEGKYRVLKGGGMTANPMDFRISNRKYDLPDALDATYGFRCVVPVEK